MDRPPARGRDVPSSLNQDEIRWRWNAGEDGTPILSVVTDESTSEHSPSMLDGIVREGARRMLAAALEAEVAAYVEAHAEERDERGRRLVVRNGHAEGRTITTGAGPIEIEQPRVNDKRIDEETGERARFRSSIIPPWCRKSPKVAEVLPLMYRHGMSTGDFVPALGEFSGTSAGLSSSVITRFTKQWQAERDAFGRRDLSGVDYVYVWVDGIHFNVNIRLEEERLCCLVVVGVRHRRRLPGIDGQLGRSAARPPPPRDAGSGARRRRRRPRLLGGAARTCGPRRRPSGAGCIMPSSGLCRVGTASPCGARVSGC